MIPQRFFPSVRAICADYVNTETNVRNIIVRSHMSGRYVLYSDEVFTLKIIQSSTYYRPPTKLRKGSVFTPVCLSTEGRHTPLVGSTSTLSRHHLRSK